MTAQPPGPRDPADVALRTFFANRIGRETEAVLGQMTPELRARAERGELADDLGQVSSPWVGRFTVQGDYSRTATEVITCARRYLMVSGRVVGWTDDRFVMRRQSDGVWMLADWEIGPQETQNEGLAAAPAITVPVSFLAGPDSNSIDNVTADTVEIGPVAGREVARTAIEELLSGPDGRSTGVTAIPVGARLRSISVEDGIATVDLTASSYDSDDLCFAAEAEQLTQTLSHVLGITGVVLQSDGTEVHRWGSAAGR